MSALYMIVNFPPKQVELDAAIQTNILDLRRSNNNLKCILAFNCYGEYPAPFEEMTKYTNDEILAEMDDQNPASIWYEAVYP